MNPYGNYSTQGFQPYMGGGMPAGQGVGGMPVSPGQGMGQQPQYGGQQGGQGMPFIPGSGGFNVPIPAKAPTSGPQVPGMLPIEESYIENILRLNKGKLATVYMTFEGSSNGAKRQQVFKGIIEAAGRDHIILSDPQTGMRYLLLMVYLDYVTFDEEIEYEYMPGTLPGLGTYSPR